MNCDFKDRFNEALRDRIVGGLLNESIQKRLLTWGGLTFKCTVEIGIVMETAGNAAI